MDRHSKFENTQVKRLLAEGRVLARQYQQYSAIHSSLRKGSIVDPTSLEKRAILHFEHLEHLRKCTYFAEQILKHRISLLKKWLKRPSVKLHTKVVDEIYYLAEAFIHNAAVFLDHSRWEDRGTLREIWDQLKLKHLGVFKDLKKFDVSMKHRTSIRSHEGWVIEAAKDKRAYGGNSLFSVVRSRYDQSRR